MKVYHLGEPTSLKLDHCQQLVKENEKLVHLNVEFTDYSGCFSIIANSKCLLLNQL